MFQTGRRGKNKDSSTFVFFPQCRNEQDLRKKCLSETQDDAVTSSFQEIRSCAMNSICRGFYRSHRDIREQHIQYHTDFSCTHSTPGRAQRHLPHVPTAEQFPHLPSFKPYYHLGEICPFGPKPPAGAAVRHHAVSHPHLMGHTGGDGHENKQKNKKSGWGEGTHGQTEVEKGM